MRIKEFDVLKGMAISVVVLIHAVFFNFEKLPPLSQELLLIVSSFLAPAIAIFFFISGFLGYRSYAKRSDFWDFEKNKLMLIIPPYLTWATIYLLFQIFLGEAFDIPYKLEFWTILKQYILGETFLPFYYIVLLILFYVLTPVVSRFTFKRLKNMISFASLMGMLFVGLYLIPQYAGKEVVSSLTTYRNPFIWIPFYLWGIKSSKEGNTFWRKLPSHFEMFIFALTYVLAVIEVISVPKLNEDFESYFMLGPLAYAFYFPAVRTFLWVGYLLVQRRKRITTIFETLGRNSFGIYLDHGFVLYSLLGIFMLANKNVIHESNLALTAIAGTLGIALCYLLSEGMLHLPEFIRRIVI